MPDNPLQHFQDQASGEQYVSPIVTKDYGIRFTIDPGYCLARDATGTFPHPLILPTDLVFGYDRTGSKEQVRDVRWAYHLRLCRLLREFFDGMSGTGDEALTADIQAIIAATKERLES